MGGADHQSPRAEFREAVCEPGPRGQQSNADLAGGLGVGFRHIDGAAFVAVYPNYPASPPTWAVASVFVVAVGMGALFGVLPARRATRLDPVAALAGR